MMLDEPSLGLAPLLVEEIFEIIGEINRREGVAILLVEQNAQAALSVSSYGYIMENGRVVLDGPVDRLMNDQDVREFYLGLGRSGGRKSYREVKHYKRRKRWLS
jgi:branched-chain amino acid transport system ATP-binding protein